MRRDTANYTPETYAPHFQPYHFACLQIVAADVRRRIPERIDGQISASSPRRLRNGEILRQQCRCLGSARGPRAVFIGSSKTSCATELRFTGQRGEKWCDEGLGEPPNPAGQPPALVIQRHRWLSCPFWAFRVDDRPPSSKTPAMPMSAEISTTHLTNGSSRNHAARSGTACSALCTGQPTPAFFFPLISEGRTVEPPSTPKCEPA